MFYTEIEWTLIEESRSRIMTASGDDPALCEREEYRQESTG